MGGTQKSKAKGGAAQPATSSHLPSATDKKRLKVKEAAKVANRKAGQKSGAGKENESPPSTPAAKAAPHLKRKTAVAADHGEHEDPPPRTPVPSGARATAALSTEKAPTNKTNRSARDLELARLKRIEVLYEEEQANQRKQKKQAVKRVKKAVQQQLDDEDDSITIPRPPGSAGKDYSLQVAMGLANRGEKYKDLRRVVKHCIDRGGLDYKLHMHEQDVVKLGNVYKVARAAAPFLKRFARDWATKDYVCQLLRNRRQDDRKRKAKLAKEEAAAAAAQDPDLDDFGTDEEVQDDSGSDED